MREISLDHLRTLVTVVNLGSLAAAARARHIAPPTVTVHIAELEQRLGARLLLRGGGPAAPTFLGQRFVARARRLLADADFAIAEIRDAREGRAGEVRLGASTGVLAHLMPSVLETLRRIAPEIRLRPAILTSCESMLRVAAASLDIAIVALPQEPVAGIRIQRWRRDPIQALVPAEWQPPKRVTAKWLADKALILNDASTNLFRQTAEWFAASGVDCRPYLETNYADAARNLVAASYGAALLPQEATRASPDPRIAVRPLSPPLWRQLGIATRKGDDEGPIAYVQLALARAVA